MQAREEVLTGHSTMGFSKIFRNLAEFIKTKWTVLLCKYYDFKYRNRYKDPKFIAAIKEAERELEDPNTPVFHTMEELIADLNSDDDDDDD